MNFLCLLCHEPAQKTLALCEACEKMLPYYQDSHDRKNNYPADFNQTIILFDYRFPVDCLITQLKFQHCLINANLLGNLLINKIKLFYKNQLLPELIIPVPLHIQRLRERGFNQALEIAKILSKKLNIRIDKSSCYRTRYTIAQSALQRKDRLKNLKNAFGLKKPLPARHVALIDDVITTGETLKELAHTLKKSGIEKIDIWCCAKTAIHSDD